MWLNRKMLICLRVAASLRLRGETAADVPESGQTQPRATPAITALPEGPGQRGRGEAGSRPFIAISNSQTTTLHAS